MSTKDNDFNIDNYTNEELYKLMGVMPNITDRELEIVILENLKKYKEDETLSRFFLNVYDRFFEQEHDEQEHDEEKPLIENMTSGTSTNIGPASDSVKAVALTNPLNYSKDNLNPLLNQTIKRIVSIDSQYRSSQYPYSTSFTLDLSEPLRDVVSIKLYSVQIPYTWYTINKDFGSNFLYLKGTSPGINNGNYNYIVDISAGNYSAQNLVINVNNSFIKNKSLYTDISFGITDISYNSFTSTATIQVEINKFFNETSYYLYFPSFINPILNPTPLQRSYTLPSYLGFDTSSIPINIIYSNKYILPYKSITAIGDENNSIFILSTIDNSNNYFNIIQYVGTIKYDTDNYAFITNEQDPSSNILQTITLQLTLPNGNYSRDQLQTNLNTQLQNNIYLYDSSLARIERTDAPFSYYNMTLVLNQSTTTNIPNAKIAVSFPNESSYTYPIWTGTNSCFYFDPSYVEVSDLIGETSLLTSNFFITNTPTIYLQCTQVGYINPLNDYYIVVQNAPDTSIGYTLTEYINAINKAISVTNTATGNNNLTTSNFALILSTPTFIFDINTTFTTKNYGIDFTNSVLNYFYGTTYNGTDLSGNLSTTIFTFGGLLVVASNYSIPVDSNLKTIPNNLVTIYPQTSLGNSNANPFNIPFIYTITANTQIQNGFLIYTNRLDLASDINNSIIQFTDQNGENPLTNTILSYTGVTNNAYVSQLSVSVLKNITQNGYNANLYDVVNGQPSYIENSWKTYLEFENNTYILSQYSITGTPYSQFTGTLIVFGESITLYDNSNNYFYIKPLPNADGLYTTTAGSYSNTYYNDIRVDISAGTYTTTIQLFEAINNAFTNNPLTKGSYISSITSESSEYTKLRLNVNKIFTANDYSIVFYDTESFVKCYVGDTSVRNTTWDTTLGWILGFQAEQVYPLSQYIDPSSNIATITGDTSVNTNLYNYLLLSLDDFNQNRINDGVVTITKNQISLPLPSYASMSNFTCDICGNKISSGSTNVATNNLTLNQVYSLNQVLNAQQNQPKTYTTGPFVKDVFAYIPLKVSGLQNGQSYVETSGQLQQQERLYFGPINIYRMSITLYNDKGTVLDLNGTNFSFSFICEQLYQKQKI